MKYSYIVGQSMISVMNTETGEVARFFSTDDRYTTALELVKESNFDAVFALTEKSKIENVLEQHSGNFNVRIADGAVKYDFNNSTFVLNNVMTDRMINMFNDGFDMKPMINFVNNLLANPSKTAIDELYGFLAETSLPITDDGHFIAYKIVRDDYTSHFDKKFMNAVGTVVEMPRSMVDDNRDRTCSTGLHFCSKEYLSAYGSTADNSDRLVLVKINPADVVSIPSDYNNAKGRASKYLIWKDITEKDWRNKYCAEDYNDSSVEKMEDYEDDEDDEYELDNFDACPSCESVRSIKKGVVSRFGKDYQRLRCQDCGSNYYVEV